MNLRETIKVKKYYTSYGHIIEENLLCAW